MGWRASGAPARCIAPAATDQLVRFAGVDSGGMMGGAMMRLMPMRVLARAGRVTIELDNLGTRPHELLVFPLAAGQVPGRRSIGVDDRINEAASLGEVSPVCAQGPDVDGIAVGNVARVNLELRPGRYEIVCNLPGHYRRGMWATLVVS